jgi:hypothetical protein
MCTMHIGLSHTKITTFRNLGTPLIAASEPAHSNGYDSSTPPPPKKKVGHPCYKNLNPKFTFTLYIYRATVTGYLCREVRTDVSYGYAYLAYDLG